MLELLFFHRVNLSLDASLTAYYIFCLTYFVSSGLIRPILMGFSLKGASDVPLTNAFPYSEERLIRLFGKTPLPLGSSKNLLLTLHKGTSVSACLF